MYLGVRNMTTFDELLLDVILITFPILIYLILEAYRKNIGKDEKNMFLDFALFSSLYLVLKFGCNPLSKCCFIVFNAILILAYLKNRKFVAISISIYGIIHYFHYYDFNILILIFEYLIYYLIYLLNNKEKITKYEFVNLIMLLKILFLSFNIITSGLFDVNNFNVIFRALGIFVVFFAVTYFSLILFDIGEEVISYHYTLKELEQEKQIRMSLFKITHEIKNPIAVCKGYLDMFDVNNKEHSKKYIPILKEEVERTLILLQDFLSFTKVNVEKDIMDINMLLEEVYDNFKLMMKDKKIDSKLNVDEELYINGDYNRLSQVIINLIKNSIESINKENGFISVSSKEYDESIVICIEDNGEGISKENLNKLEEPFFTTKKKGTGLGVSLSKEIIRAHDGTLTFESELYKGTKAIIKLKKS